MPKICRIEARQMCIFMGIINKLTIEFDFFISFNITVLYFMRDFGSDWCQFVHPNQFMAQIHNEFCLCYIVYCPVFERMFSL